MPVYRLPEDIIFPYPEYSESNGLLAIGGDLSAERLLLAYENGIFPWFNDDEPILWWSPDPRSVLFPGKIRISRSMRKILKKRIFNVTYDKDFLQVMSMCRELRLGHTWISEDMLQAYNRLHNLGYAHSVEVWYENDLIGGLYGVSLGKCFFGESMFSKVANASKVAIIDLAEKLLQNNFKLIDCQIHSKHLGSLGAENIPRKKFLKLLEDNVYRETIRGNWSQEILKK